MPVSKPNIESDLLQRISTRLSLLAEERPWSSGWFREYMAEREAKVVVEDLKEHLPHLWEQIQKWELIATEKQDSCRKLTKHLKNKGIPLRLFESGLEEGLRFLSRSQKEESLPRLPDKLEIPQDVGLWLFHSPATREPLEALRRSRNALVSVYAQLEDKLIPSELRQTLLERRCSHCPVPQDELPSRKITE